MTVISTQQIHDLLGNINTACVEIQRALNEHLEATTSSQYITDIEKDMVILENLKLIIVAVKGDIESEKVGASTELLLRIAANDFKNKVARIPEKKVLREEVAKTLKEVHHHVLRMMIKKVQ